MPANGRWDLIVGLKGECSFAYDGEWLAFDILGAKVSPHVTKHFTTFSTFTFQPMR